MSMKKVRSARRLARAAALNRVGQAASFAPIKGRRTTQKRRSALRNGMIAATFVVTLIVMSVSAPKLARAAGGDAPEIDPGSIASALTLLAGGVLTLTDRVRRARSN